MPAHLIALNDGPSILVDKPILLVGRHPECDVQIESRKISRRHCCIAQVNDYLIVRDLDSTNGVRINGVRVVEGKLKPGDELTVGNQRYKVTWDESPARKAVASSQVNAATLNEDDMLEACDEPVLLSEQPAESAGKSRFPKPKTDESFVLPDDLKLLPSSGSFPGGTGAPQT